MNKALKIHQCLGYNRLFSTTAATNVKRKWVPDYPEKHQRQAQKRLNWKFHREAILAQRKRLKWEYPVQPDLRSTWKHRRWYDTHLNKWVDTMPIVDKKKFANFYKDRRQHIFLAETPYEFNKMLLDDFTMKKFIINPFDYEIYASNISYYYQYLTNTKYVHGMPLTISQASINELTLSNFREFVENVLLLEHNNSSHNLQEDPLRRAHQINEACMRTIFNYLITTLSSDNLHCSNCEVDHDIENAAFWLRGRGFLKWTLPDDLPHLYQCHDPVLMQIRTADQLSPFSPYLGEFSTSGEIPTLHTSPIAFANVQNQYRNVMIPGYRLYAGDVNQNYQFAKDAGKLAELPPPTYNECKYGHTQLILLPETYSREWYKESLEHADVTGEIEEHLKGRGIMSGWVWNAAQAHCALYWMDKDVDKPFCSQSIVTDGQWLSFFCYQLNTIAIDADNIEDNSKRNICFGETSIKLYDEISPDGVIGLNDDALSLLIKFVQNDKNRMAAHNDEEVEHYNTTLHVQEVDKNNPEIELQKPLHKVELDTERKILQDAKNKEEMEQKTLKTKIKEFLM